MPLEQIRRTLALDPEAQPRQWSSYNDETSSSTRHSPDEPAERADWDEDVSPPRRSLSTRKKEEMSLSKLGGVGGVTRSGSWGRNSSILGCSNLSPGVDASSITSVTSSSKFTRSPHPLSEEDEMQEKDDAVLSRQKQHDQDHGMGFTARSIARGCQFGSGSSGVPSSSSRTSTSSSSAAAFSLRSVSNRNSTGSTSSNSSILSRSTAEEESEPVTLTNADREDDLSTVSGRRFCSDSTSDVASTVGCSESISTGGAGAGQSTPDYGRSTNTPSVFSLRSLGSGGQGSISSTDPEPRAEHQVAALHPPTSSTDEAQQTSSWQDSESGKAPLDGTPGLNHGSDDTVTVSAATMHTSPGDGDTVDESDAQVSPKTLKPSAQLTKREASPVRRDSTKPQQSTEQVQWPPPPRKHSGGFMLRSRSQLASHAGLQMTFTHGGGGRAAARDRARDQNAWDNAPFSVLEARRAANLGFAVSQPSSPGLIAQADAPSRFPANMILTSTSQESAKPEPVETLILDDTNGSISSPGNTTTPGFDELHRTESDPTVSSSLSGGSLGGRGQLTDPSSVGLPVTQAVTEHRASTGSTISSKPRLHIPTISTTSSRPVMSRSPSMHAANVLRTPTTEEWSRFLESQGVNLPSGRHSRAGTAFSAISTGQLSSRLTRSVIPATGSRTDFGSDLGDGDDDNDDLDSDDSDDELSADLLEKLKQLGLSRAASRAGSVLGEDLESLHEEEEEEEEEDEAAQDEADKARLSSSVSSSRLHRPLPISAKELAFSPSLPAGGSPHTSGSPSTGSGWDVTPQPTPDRTQTIRSPRSKRPTREAQSQAMLYATEHHSERNINDFVILSDIGRGAYGLVKKARMKDSNGAPSGDEVIIKYIIKSRILADCWRRHRILGPIPIEIHVMDQLRRLPYAPPPHPPPWSPRRARVPGVYPPRAPTDFEHEDTRQNSGNGGDTSKDSTDVSTFSTTLPTSEKGMSHPNICKMLDFFEDHEFYYMVMPCFGTGQDLFDYVESSPAGLHTFQVRSIFGQVADALRFLHANNIVHRDIKDENVILDGQGNAQLIDFGSAAHVRPGRLFDTFSGTLDYAAAEVLRGEKYAGPPQDIWALGVVGYVLLCGECPFWNGEEAIQGLSEGSRAEQTLRERCLLGAADGNEGPSCESTVTTEPEPEHGAIDPAWSPDRKRASEEPDGGGRLEDAADLIARCLEVDQEDRPTAEQVCQHRFLAGGSGWTGPRGWLAMDGQKEELAQAVPATTS